MSPYLRSKYFIQSHGWVFLVVFLLLSVTAIAMGKRGEMYFKIEDCNKRVRGKDGVEKVYHCVTSFSDDFEDMLVFKETGWHQLLLDSSDGRAGDPRNKVERIMERAHSGAYALKAYTPSSQKLQKASLARGLLFFPPGSDFWFSGWFYVAGGKSIEDLFIFDVKSTRTFKYRGRRLMFTGKGGNYLILDSKRAGRQILQKGTPVLFPRNQWVHLKVHLHLSISDDGIAEVWQDGKMILYGTGLNIPEDTFYDWIEIGITANPTKESQTVYVDDVVISNQPISD